MLCSMPACLEQSFSGPKDQSCATKNKTQLAAHGANILTC